MAAEQPPRPRPRSRGQAPRGDRAEGRRPAPSRLRELQAGASGGSENGGRGRTAGPVAAPPMPGARGEGHVVTQGPGRDGRVPGQAVSTQVRGFTPEGILLPSIPTEWAPGLRMGQGTREDVAQAGAAQARRPVVRDTCGQSPAERTGTEVGSGAVGTALHFVPSEKEARRASVWARRDQRLGASGLIVLPSGGRPGPLLLAPALQLPACVRGRAPTPTKPPGLSPPGYKGSPPGVLVRWFCGG